MSDPDTSGAKATEPAETAASTPSVDTNGTSQPTFEFGTSSGSGLARGKRNSKAAPVAASTAPTTDYTPTAIEVVSPKSEYQNPFAPVEPAAKAAPAAPVEETKPEPAAPAAAVVKETVAPAPKPVVEKPAKVEAPQVDEPKAELNILPPAESKQTAQSWEASPHDTSESSSRSQERATFRPERHARRDENGEARSPRSREPRRPREPRGPRETREPRAPREPREARVRRPRTAPAAAQPVKKSGGFFGWLKSLFSGGTGETTPEKHPSRNGHDSEHPRRRNRGGRGRNRQGGGQGNGQGRGPRDSQNRGGRSRDGREGGDRPRRSRGGRNRRNGGGGSNPRPEGQQGGGAI